MRILKPDMFFGLKLHEIQEQLVYEGFVVLKQVFSPQDVASLLGGFLQVTNRILDTAYTDPQDPEMVHFFQEHPEAVGRIYDECKNLEALNRFAFHKPLTSVLKAIMGHPVGCLNKKIFRIDVPLCLKELAHWHQDYFYVLGNTKTLTAWIALSEVKWQNGCLSVMPGSHKNGILAHDLKIGKRDVPSSIFGNPTRFVEMEAGDALLFDPLLLHSSNLNVSSTIRFSLQYRYTPAHLPVSAGMGGMEVVQ